MTNVVTLKRETYRTGQSWAIGDVLHQTENRMRSAHATHLGYPYNLVGYSAVPASLGDYLVNNLGDPYVGSHYGSHICDLEREAVAWLMDLWQCDDHDAFWGSVVASGTEGNIWALYLAREAFPNAKLLYSREAHYSIPKAARILRMEAIAVDCETGGAIDIEAFAKALDTLDGSPVIVALTCGTTVKGRMTISPPSSPASTWRALVRTGDLSMSTAPSMPWCCPFAAGAPFAIQPSFRHGIDSLSTSGHKMIGTPMPCGVLIARRRARRPRRLGDRLSAIERHDADGVAQRPCRVVDLVAADRLRRERLSGRRMRLPCPHRAPGRLAARRRCCRCCAIPTRSRWSFPNPAKPSCAPISSPATRARRTRSSCRT